ncbi:MAG: ATP-binding cassette domain-containing protein [Bryobacterales bacterium]|nr:ATP-binding cassette domain-containing protein [Bryobacterales bacterium]
MTPDSPPVLKFEHVSVSFDGQIALDDVSFEVREGDSRILFGAAGSGKTVLLKAALGLVRPDSGHIFVFGQDITLLKESQLSDIRSKVGMLFQESALFDSMTIAENVAYPLFNQKAIHCEAAEGRQKVVDALRFVELENTLAKFPSELSGGMRRRAAIARAVVTGPPLLLYDSPTAGLDPITANNIIALIVKARDASRTTTLMVTHRYQDGNLVAKFRYNLEGGRLEHVTGRDPGFDASTRFMVFKEGRLVFDGPQKELEESSDPYISKFVLKRD